MDLENIKSGKFGYGLTKILGKQIKEINGYVTTEFGEPTFEMTSVVLEDDTTIACEGEHDCAYLAYNKDLDEKCQEIHDLEDNNE